MMCGAKCFLVEIEHNGVKEVKEVISRSPVNARKVIRGKYGADIEILSVREKKEK